MGVGVHVSCQSGQGYYVMSCHDAMPSHGVMVYPVWRHGMSCRDVSSHGVMSCHVISYHVISCHVMMSDVMSCHIMSCDVSPTHLVIVFFASDGHPCLML